ncbi:YceI-like domain-containing protein [Pseudoduganella lurida]|uniref:YceI-like domain-containing protein n=1 Tax=Pseudoduganella lurida TaxID=1036180 RepID=A0A562RGG6_9BURK|nr:YceI-like domain-containing protein [Pseudoduganella lurida]
MPADPFAELFAGRLAGALPVGDDALVAVTVRRGGALARLGHDHVVAARRIAGYADPRQGRAVLRFRLDEMTVDEAGLRQEAGLAKQPSADAIAGTRENMLTKVLDAARFPFVEIRAQRLAGDTAHLQTDITLHGVTRRYLVPSVLATAPAGLVARGTLVLKQTDFGITPFSVLGGAMAVQDDMEIRFVIPVTAPGSSGAPAAVR